MWFEDALSWDANFVHDRNFIALARQRQSTVSMRTAKATSKGHPTTKICQ